VAISTGNHNARIPAGEKNSKLEKMGMAAGRKLGAKSGSRYLK